MKNIFIIIFISIFFFPISCKKNVDKISLTNKDTLLLKENTVLFILPSSKRIEELKKKHGEDFYIIADDANYYYANAIEFMDSLHGKYSNQYENITIAYIDRFKIKTIPKFNSSWYSILYKNKKFKNVDLVNFKKEYTLFFDDSSKIQKSLNAWHGVYLNTDIEKMESYASIIKRVGWYKLTIKADEITFESDKRMESEFPTESPGGLYINYKCNYKITGDTISLFEKTNNTDKQPKEMNRINISPVLTLYKNGKKFYGISDDITESENLSNAIRIKVKSPYIFKKFKN
ncbi:hypothetical protein [Chryseobacterium paludis]|uniref:hypothetical protein n=1 Tax=Chryseobacterium paludis TaxID=2956784 RepID=UPI0021C059AE|nr:hypothetical protein [Chryseobacterium paludis]